MATRTDDIVLFKRGRRWWLHLCVKGEGKKIIALKPDGQTHATTNRDVARAIARDIRRQVEEKGRIERPTGAADLPALIEQFKAVNTVEASEGYDHASISLMPGSGFTCLWAPISHSP